MSAAPYPPGSLLAERFRVVSDARGAAFRVIDARDEAAGERWVRLVVVQSDAAAAAIEGAVRRLQRYAVGVAGHAELAGAFQLEPGQVGLAYALDDAPASSDGLPDASVAASIERALRPLHDQGMAHGALAPELVGRTADGGVLLLGFGIVQALGRSASPATDANVLSSWRGTLQATEPERPPQPAPPPPVPAPAPEPELVPAPPVASPSPAARRSSAPPSAARAWLGPLALGLGGLAMIAGVTTAFVFSKRLGPAPSASLPVAAPPPPPATALTPPLAPPALPSPSALPSPGESAEPHAPLSPPMRTGAPAVHAEAPLPVGTQPAWGPARAPVTLTLFADLECPHTRALLPELMRLKTEFGDDLRWVFRHRPLSQHDEGERAARLLAGVAEQLGPGVFWKLVSELGADADAPVTEVLEQWLDKSGVDAARRSELESLPTARTRVDDDQELAARLFVRATPAIFVNGQRFEGFQPESALEGAIERERRAGVFALLAGASPDDVYVQRTARNLINLGEDPPERACVGENGAPVRGPAKAPISLVHFCAYESAYCQQAEPALAALLARHPREVRVVWRAFPIAPEGDGRTAANFALAARKAGGDKAFWNVHRALLEARAVVDAPVLAKAVKELGMDAESLLSAARARQHDAGVKADMELGRKLGVTGVPTTFVNGRRKDGLLTLAELEALVTAELEVARHVREAGHPSVSELVCTARGER